MGVFHIGTQLLYNSYMLFDLRLYNVFPPTSTPTVLRSEFLLYKLYYNYYIYVYDV